MKVILLAANGGNRSITGFIGFKPKHLYSYQGQIQLERILNQLLEAGFKERDISIVAGFKYQKIIDFLKEKGFNIRVKINHNWKKSAAWSLKTAMEGIDEDFMLVCADEILKTEFYSHFFNRDHDRIFLYGSCAQKLLKKHIPILRKLIEKYLDQKYVSARTYSRIHNLEHIHNASSHEGMALTYILYEIIDFIEDFEEIKASPPKNYWIGDCDYFHQTDEYKNMNSVFRFVHNLYCILFNLYLYPRKFINFISKKVMFNNPNR